MIVDRHCTGSLLERSHLLLGVTVALAVAGCSLFGVSGSGPVVTQARPVAGFTSIDAGGGIAVEVTIGDVSSVEVETQENLQPLIATTVEGSTLRIHSTQAYSAATAPLVRIVMPDLDALDLSGGSRGAVDGLAADHVEFDINGGSALRAAGTVDALTIGASGGARADLQDLSARTVQVEASGGAAVNLTASETVTGSASGGASVSVAGAAQLNVESSGGASVDHR